ncbi:MAG: HAD family hydrolase [Pirellulales bacterium]
MNRPLADILRRHLRPMEPLTTDQPPRLRPLPGLKAVLFDVYGPLVVSASGEVGTALLASRDGAFCAALREVGLELAESGSAAAAGPQGVDILIHTIEQFQQELREAGIEHPEVEIREVWRRTLERLVDAGRLPPEALRADRQRLAVEYESRVNPCWPMPHALECLGRLRQLGMRLGIVSNAQFYTLELLPLLLGQSLVSLNIDPGLQYYSFHHGQAKPGRFLFDRATARLAEQGVGPGETLYVGNDMLNDILPAHEVGFRTAWFAGDGRSLRRRQDDPRVAGIEPDLVVTDLADLAGCVEQDNGDFQK